MSVPINASDDLRIGATGATSAWLNGVQVWPSGPVVLGAYRIFAAGQTLSSGSNTLVDLDAGTEENIGDINGAYVFDATLGVYAIKLADDGIYSGAAHVDFGGTVFPANIHAQISAFDFGSASADTGQYAPGTDPINMDTTVVTGGEYGWDVDGKVTLATTPDNFFTLLAGPGVHSGTTITTATYITVIRWSA